MVFVRSIGYQGVELALLEASQVNVGKLRNLLIQYGLVIPVISTGQVFSEGKIWFTHPDESIRKKAIARMWS